MRRAVTRRALTCADVTAVRVLATFPDWPIRGSARGIGARTVHPMPTLSRRLRDTAELAALIAVLAPAATTATLVAHTRLTIRRACARRR